MSQSRINWRYLEREEYLLARKRASELFDFLKPWLQFPFPGGLRPDAPEECKELYKEFQETVCNILYTEAINPDFLKQYRDPLAGSFLLRSMVSLD